MLRHQRVHRSRTKLPRQESEARASNCSSTAERGKHHLDVAVEGFSNAINCSQAPIPGETTQTRGTTKPQCGFHVARVAPASAAQTDLVHGLYRHGFNQRALSAISDNASPLLHSRAHVRARPVELAGGNRAGGDTTDLKKIKSVISIPAKNTEHRAAASATSR